MNKRIHALISGRVQGVWYRASTQKKAQALGLSGWVRNLTDGRVELVAEGEQQHLQEFIDWCWHGPELAEVTEIKKEWSSASNEFSDFSTKTNL